MAKGISIKFSSYDTTISKILDVIKLDNELKKHDKIILKPFLRTSDSLHTSPEFVEAVLKYVLDNKNPDASVLIAEGSDGEDTMDVFEKLGFKSLSEKYSIGLIDLNKSQIEEVSKNTFSKYTQIKYPKVLLESFVISLPRLSDDENLEMQGSLSNMIGAFPSKEYSGFLSKKKNKLYNIPSRYNIHDIVMCKMPNLAVIDASEHGHIIAGVPLDMDKVGAKLLGKEWKSISHLRLIDEGLVNSKNNSLIKQEEDTEQSQ